MGVAVIRTIFAGTPEFAVASLKAVLARPELETVAVYTQPDRPAGRGRRLTASPIKKAALAAGIPIEQPQRANTTEVIARFKDFGPQLLVVAAYGLILPDAFIDPPVTAINVHASLLPRWRGAAPIQRALMAGDAQTGISIMRVVRQLDAGPVWFARACAIDPQDTGGSLHDRLAKLGAAALDEAISQFIAGTLSETAQDEATVTYAAKIIAADREIDWSQPAEVTARQVRALNPLPGAVTRLRGLEVKVLAGRSDQRPHTAAPGTVLSHAGDGIVIATGTGAYTILELQPAGKQRMSAQSFSNGYGSHL